MDTHPDPDEIKEKYQKYVDYLRVDYLNDTQFSFMDRTIVEYLIIASDDMTNNPVESRIFFLKGATVGF